MSDPFGTEVFSLSCFTGGEKIFTIFLSTYPDSSREGTSAIVRAVPSRRYAFLDSSDRMSWSIGSLPYPPTR